MHAKVDGEIKYLFDAPPEPGATQEVLPGLTWVRVPLPFVLNHVNCWLLEDGRGSSTVTLIDTGADKPQTRELWDQVLASRTVSRLICTHGHPDHVGLSGWLGFKVTNQWVRNPARQLLEDLPTLQKLDQYQEVESKDFLERLQKSRLFDETSEKG